MAVSIVFSFFTTRILLQSLGASDYGLYNVVGGALAMLGFLSASLSSTTQRFISYAEGEGDNERILCVVNTAVRLHNMLALAVCAFFVVMGYLIFRFVLNIPDGRTAVAVAVYGFMIVSTVFSITIVPYDGVLNAHENMKYYSLLGIADVIAKFAIALMVMLAGSLDKLLFYGALMAAEAWAFRMATKQYCVKHYNEVRNLDVKRYASKEMMREMTSFAGWNLLNIASAMILLYGNNMIVNHFYGTLVNAAMGVATQLSGVLMGVSQNMTKALTPVLVKNEGCHNREQMIRISLLGCKFSYLLFAFFALPVIFCLKPLLQLWLSDVPEWAEVFCLLMLVSVLIEQLFLFLFSSINAQGSIKGYNIVVSTLNFLAIIVVYIELYYGFPPYFATLNYIIFRVLFGGIINVYYSHRNFGLRYTDYFSKVFLPCFVTTAAILALCYVLRPDDSTSTALMLLQFMAMLIISIPAYYIFAFSKDERNNVLRIIQSKLYQSK